MSVEDGSISNLAQFSVKGVEWQLDNVSNVYPEEKLPTKFFHNYNTNNGFVTFVDQTGEQYIAKDTPANIKILQAEGYTLNRELSVPFSNGELPAREELKTKFAKVIDCQPTVAELVEEKMLLSNAIDAHGRKFLKITYQDQDFILKPHYQDYADSETEVQLVDKSLVGILEIASKFSIQAQQILSQIKQNNITPKVILLLDRLVAANHIELTDDAGYRFLGEPDSFGYALCLLDLLGDPQAKDLIDKKLEHLRQHDKAQKNSNFETSNQTNTEPLNPKDLAVVHATRYQPKQGADGQYLIPTTFNVTNGASLRTTIHTTLNHKVLGHANGDWSDAGYVVVSPFTEVLNANGIPLNLNTVDTYWSCDPGQYLEMPKAILVHPEANLQKLFDIRESEIVYREKPYNSSDIKEINQYGKIKLELPWFELQHQGENPQIIAEKLGSLAELFESILKENGYIHDNIAKFMEDFPELSSVAKQLLISTFSTQIENQAIDVLTKICTNKAIEKLGKNVKPGGSNAWGDSWKVTEQTQALAKQLGCAFGPHFMSANDELEDAVDYAKRNKKELDPGSFIKDLDPQSRRAIYLAGL